MRSTVQFVAVAALALVPVERAEPAVADAAAAPSPIEAFRDPDGPVIVIAHRGCHNPSPDDGLAAAPENSLVALEQCVRLGVDVMETDVRRTRDGYLVMIHDETVDRTTNGHGRVSELTLAAIRALRLRQNLGGAGQDLTDQTVPTLDEMLATAKGRILLNLDVKDAIYVEVVAAVEQARQTDGVIIKTMAGPATPPLSAMAPYDRVPFAVIPANGGSLESGLAGIIDRQAAATPRPIAIELPTVSFASLSALAARTRSARVRLWVNTLFDGFVSGGYGDLNALRSPQAVWGRLCQMGVTIFQTDEPAALLRYRSQPGQPCSSGANR